MKKLIFIDNDSGQATQEDKHCAEMLLWFNDLDEGHIKGMEVIEKFAFIPREDAAKVLFDPSNVILTHSMYTENHYNSLGQMLGFLKRAAQHEIEGKVYIDTSGNITEAIQNNLEGCGDDILSILHAIETNHILTHAKDGSFKLHRLRVSLKGLYQDMLRLEDVDLAGLLGE